MQHPITQQQVLTLRNRVTDIKRSCMSHITAFNGTLDICNALEAAIKKEQWSEVERLFATLAAHIEQTLRKCRGVGNDS